MAKEQGRSNPIQAARMKADAVWNGPTVKETRDDFRVKYEKNPRGVTEAMAWTVVRLPISVAAGVAGVKDHPVLAAGLLGLAGFTDNKDGKRAREVDPITGEDAVTLAGAAGDPIFDAPMRFAAAIAIAKEDPWLAAGVVAAEVVNLGLNAKIQKPDETYVPKRAKWGTTGQVVGGGTVLVGQAMKSEPVKNVGMVVLAASTAMRLQVYTEKLIQTKQRKPRRRDPLVG